MKHNKTAIMLLTVILLSAVLLALPRILQIPAHALEDSASNPSVTASGPFGSGTTPSEYVQYVLYSDGTMEITGTGATFSCGWDGAAQPFAAYRDQIRHLVIGEGVTQLRKGSFAFLSNLETVSFPSTVTALHNNCFMGSFTESVTSFTIPASVTQVGGFLVGRSQGCGAIITDIRIENPEAVFDTSATPINGGQDLSSLRLYSYGTDNAVSAYADAIGCGYVDLDTYFIGSAGGVAYTLSGSSLTLAAESCGAVITADTQPWLAHIDAAGITELIIEEGFSSIRDGAFADYNGLTNVTIGEGLHSIGDGAFRVSSDHSALTVKLPHSLQTLGSQIFSGRSDVRASVYYGTAASELSEPNVQLRLIRRMNLLLIGNSYSHDAVNFSFDTPNSQFFDMLRSMLGEDAEITVAAAYSAAATMAWHATQAELGTGEYSLYVIGTDYPQWTLAGYMNADQTLAWKDWDAVVLQPYGQESINGINEPTRPGEEAEKFGTLEAAAEYMLDYVAQRVPNAKVYYYMIWRRTRDLKLNAGLDLYEPMGAFTPQVMDYEGPDTGKRFADVIPAGTAIHFARSTYLALLSHNPDTYLERVPTPQDDPQIGLQRDTGHVTFCIGRFIVSRTLAETVIPAEMRVDGYVLPGIRDSESIGKLPGEYTLLANKIVDAALESWHASEDRLVITGIEGFETDPAVKAGETLSAQTVYLDGSLEASRVENVLAEIILSTLDEDFIIEQVTVEDEMSLLPDHSYTAQVTVRFGYTTVTVSVPFEVAQPVYEKTVIPPTCTEEGCTLYIFSNGETGTSDPIAATGHSFHNGLCQSCGEVKKELRPGADGCYDYYERDEFQDDFTGFVDNGIAVWYAENGRVHLNYTGLAAVDGERYYIRSGYRSDYTGLKKLEGTWLYFTNGRVDTGYTGLVRHNGLLVYVENGEVNFGKTDILTHEGTMYYIRYGILADTFDGLVKGSDGIWRYVEKGIFTGAYTGLAKNIVGWWYVREGLIDTSFTGLGANAMGLWYVKYGQAITTYTGLVKHDGDYWYVQYGMAKESYTGIAPHNGNFYYVENGKADFTYTGSYTDANGVTYDVVKGVATAV